MKRGLVCSVLLHLAVALVVLFSFSRFGRELVPEEAITVDIVTLPAPSPVPAPPAPPAAKAAPLPERQATSTAPPPPASPAPPRPEPVRTAAATPPPPPEPPKPEPPKPEPPKPEAPKPEPPKPEPTAAPVPKPEPPKPEQAKVEPPKPEPPKPEPPKPEVAKPTPPKPEPPKPPPPQQAKPTPPKPEPKVQEARPEPPKPEPPKAEPPKQVAKAPARPEPKAEAKPAEDDFAALLRSVERLDRRVTAEQPREGTGRAAQRGGSPERGESRQVAQVSASALAGMISRQVEPCWNIPIGAQSVRGMKVELNIVMAPDGGVQTVVPLDDGRMSGDPAFRAFAESAVRAVRACSPLKLPPESYQQWRNVIFNFDPSLMAG